MISKRIPKKIQNMVKSRYSPLRECILDVGLVYIVIDFVFFPTSLAVYSLDTDWDMTFGVLYNDNIDQSFLAPIVKIVF